MNIISAIPEENLLEASPPPAPAPSSVTPSKPSTTVSAPPVYALTSPLQPTPVAPTSSSHNTTTQQQHSSDPSHQHQHQQQHQLATQLTTTLNIEPPPEWSQPAVTALPQPVAATTLAAAQPQFFSTAVAAGSPSIFATPQSLPPGTPATVGVLNPVTPPLPPPLPHIMPVYQAPIYPAGVVTPAANASAIYLTSPSTTSLGAVTTATPSSSVLMPNLAATPVALSSNTPATGETFEQKWARFQAAKKQTNPFAEDIAKKYEIKL